MTVDAARLRTAVTVVESATSPMKATTRLTNSLTDAWGAVVIAHICGIGVGIMLAVIAGIK